MNTQTTTKREGTKSHPVKIQVPVDRFCYCPKCEQLMTCRPTDGEETCPNCNHKFYVSFNLLECGL
jgi:hypothetical protein